MKAVIPVAGLGTRMLPATKAIPKEMLPVVDKPVIHYVVHEAVLAGIKEIVFVTSANKYSIENYFESNLDLELTLEQDAKAHLLSDLRSILPDDVIVTYTYQEEAKGLGHAILCARDCVGDEPFVVLLPDVLINQFSSNLAKDNLASMVSRFEKSQISQIMVEQVSQHLVSKYGIVDCVKNQLRSGEIAEIVSMIEKPSIEAAPSNLAIVGRYVFSSKIWSVLENTKAGINDEIQLTDAMNELLLHETVEAYHLIGMSHDCGNKAGYMLTNIHYALQHAEIATLIYDGIKGQVLENALP